MHILWHKANYFRVAKYIYKYYFDVAFSGFHLLGYARKKLVSDIHIHWVIDYCNYIYKI